MLNSNGKRILILISLLANAAAAAPLGVSISVQDSNGNPVADAVVYMENTAALASPANSANGVRPATAEIEQKDRRFIPLVTVIQAGAAVFFPNNDTVRHHAYSFSPARPFELKLYAGKPEAPIIFDKPGTIVIGCNIHDQMLAYIQVLDTPYFSKTDGAGKAKIVNLPAGKYQLKVWHYKQMPGAANYEQSLNLTEADTALTVRLNFKLN